MKQLIQASHDLIEKALSEHKKPVVACSFGKDSMAVLHLIRQHTKDVDILWNDTRMEYPETYDFVKRMEQEWELDIIKALPRPEHTFWYIVDRFGFPIGERRTGEKLASRNCCRYLKKYPMARALTKHKWDLNFTGLTKWESDVRMMASKSFGNYFYSKEYKLYKCHPIMDWKEEDVWEYHRMYNIPYNPLYNNKLDNYNVRTGCWCCTMGLKYGKLEHLRIYYPKLFNLLVVKKGLGDYIIDKRIEHYADSKDTNQTRKARKDAEYQRNVILKN